MTLPDERYRSIHQAEQFLKDLCDRTKTPRVPKAVRARAGAVLRHYPSQWHLDQLAESRSDIVVRKMEALHRMVVGYESTVDKGKE